MHRRGACRLRGRVGERALRRGCIRGGNLRDSLGARALVDSQLHHSGASRHRALDSKWTDGDRTRPLWWFLSGSGCWRPLPASPWSCSSNAQTHARFPIASNGSPRTAVRTGGHDAQQARFRGAARGGAPRGRRPRPAAQARTAVLVTELEGSRLGARRGEIQATRLRGDERPGRRPGLPLQRASAPRGRAWRWSGSAPSTSSSAAWPT